MEIPAWLFFSFWAVISITFSHLGFYALDKTELSNSVSPVVMFFFGLFLATSSAFSLTYGRIPRQEQRDVVLRILLAVIGSSIIRISHLGFLSYIGSKMTWLLFFFPDMMTFSRRYNLFLATGFILSPFLPWYIFPSINLILIRVEYYMNPPRNTRIAIYMALDTSLFLFHWENNILFFSVYMVSIFLCFFSLSLVKPVTNESFEQLPVVVAKVKEKKIGKLIEFAVETLGAVLFQNFFRVTSFNEVVAFLYLAAAWAANLILLSASYDFGVLNFLLGNVVLGSAVSQSGLRFTTWLAYGASLLLYCLRLKLESLTLVNRPGEEEQVKLW